MEQIRRLEEIVRTLESKVAVLEALVGSQSDAYARLEVLIGACFGMFAILMTVLVVYFGIRTEKAAARAATDAAKAELASAKSEIDEAVGLARGSCQQAEASLIKIRELEGEAEKGSLLIYERVQSTTKALAPEIDATGDFEPSNSQSSSNDAGEESIEMSLQEELDTAYEAQDWLGVVDRAVALRTITNDDIKKLKSLEFESQAYDGLAEREKEISTYHKILALAEEHPDAEVRLKYSSRALLNTAITLGQMNNGDESLEFYNQLILRFGKSEDADARLIVSRGLENRAIIYREKGDLVRQRASLMEILNRHEGVDTISSKERTATAYLNLGLSHMSDREFEKAMSFSDKIIEDFNPEESERITQIICSAHFNKALALEKLEHLEEAVKLYRQIVRKFGRTTIPKSQETVAKARAGVKRVSRRIAELPAPDASES